MRIPVRVVPAEFAGKTKFPSVHATTEWRVGERDRAEHVRVGAEDDLRARVERRRRELLLALRRDGMQLGAPVEPADDDIGLPACGANCGRDGVGVGFGRPGRVGGRVEPVRIDVGEADEADPEPARLHDHRAQRSGGVAASADGLEARRMRVPDRVQQRDRAVVARMVVRDGDDVEAAGIVRAAEERRRTAKMEFLVRNRARRASRRHLRGSPSRCPQRAASRRPASTGSCSRASTRSPRPLHRSSRRRLRRGSPAARAVSRRGRPRRSSAPTRRSGRGAVRSPRAGSRRAAPIERPRCCGLRAVPARSGARPRTPRWPPGRRGRPRPGASRTASPEPARCSGRRALRSPRAA